MNMTEELIKLRTSLLAATNASPLSVPIKVFVVEELLAATKEIAANEVRETLSAMNAEKKEMK